MRANYKVPNRVKRRMADELYMYWKNLKELEELDIDIIESSPVMDESGTRAKYRISKPTESKALQIAEAMSTRAYIMAKRRIDYVTNALKRLNKDDRQIVEYIFRDGYSQIRLEIDHAISSDTYYNVFNKIIFLTAKEFGEI